jgi:hypothetical protein
MHTDCPGWTANGECFKNPTYLYKHCPKSCGVCPEPSEEKIKTAPCSDFNTTQCHIWADSGQCAENPLAVMKQCPESCGVCKPTCTDHHEGCRAWAFAKKCYDEPAFMLRVCPASCGICTALESKDEL